MDQERSRRIRGRSLRFYWILLAVWIAAILITLTVFGGFSSPTAAISALVTLAALLAGLGGVSVDRGQERDID